MSGSGFHQKGPSMKHVNKHLAVAGLLAALGLSAVAQMPPPSAGAAAGPVMSHEGHGRADPAKKQERMTKRLGELKQKLQITSAQESAWTTYTAALKPVQVNRPDRAEFEKLSTPERIDRMRAHRAARMAEMDKRGDATKAFYAVLTGDQKKVFDAETARRGHGGRQGHHGRHNG
jgi:protein CpxP